MGVTITGTTITEGSPNRAHPALCNMPDPVHAHIRLWPIRHVQCPIGRATSLSRIGRLFSNGLPTRLIEAGSTGTGMPTS